MLWGKYRLFKIRRRLSRSSLGRGLLERADHDDVKVQLVGDLRPDVPGLHVEGAGVIKLSKDRDDDVLVRSLAHELRHYEQEALGLFALRDALAPLDAGIARRICEADAKAVEVAVCVELANSGPNLLKSLAGSRLDLARRAEHCFGRPPLDTARTIFRHIADQENWRAHYDLAEAENRLSNAMAGWPATASLPLSAFLTKAEELQVQGRPHTSAQEVVTAVMREDDQSDGRVLLLAFEHCAYGTVRSSVPVRDLHNEVSDALQATAETMLAQRRDLRRADGPLAKQAQAFASGIKAAAPDRGEAGYRALGGHLAIGLSLAARMRQLWYDRSSPELYGPINDHHQGLERRKGPFERQLTAVRAARGLLVAPDSVGTKGQDSARGAPSTRGTKHGSR